MFSTLDIFLILVHVANKSSYSSSYHFSRRLYTGREARSTDQSEQLITHFQSVCEGFGVPAAQEKSNGPIVVLLF